LELSAKAYDFVLRSINEGTLLTKEEREEISKK